MAHHAAVPVPDVLGEDRLRIYFSPRDAQGRSRVASSDVDPADPGAGHQLREQPILDLGRLGTFDDSGVMPSSIVTHEGIKYLYYIGWNQGVTVSYRNAIGLAISSDGGETFERAFEGAVVDRSASEPFFTATPFVLREPGGWRMWYASSTGWIVVDGRPEPVYVIKYAESADGVVWRRENVTCIEPKHPEEANARPWVVPGPNGYRMWFCYRRSRGYRHDPNAAYRIGYAESGDGISWQRKDEEAGIDVSDTGWDSVMLAYPSGYAHGGALHMLYNGNGFRETGIGHAVAAD
jgi:hypothetical protein